MKALRRLSKAAALLAVVITIAAPASAASGEPSRRAMPTAESTESQCKAPFELPQPFLVSGVQCSPVVHQRIFYFMTGCVSLKSGMGYGWLEFENPLPAARDMSGDLSPTATDDPLDPVYVDTVTFMNVTTGGRRELDRKKWFPVGKGGWYATYTLPVEVGDKLDVIFTYAFKDGKKGMTTFHWGICNPYVGVPESTPL
ncbi:hypothetical protein [Micromonospora sp. NPDC051141]|uniref:hypothetical protein n=1 Tax=Micromonospora sp. NPDC051141 TaxID=3364284 RepID=UPI0037A30D39